MQFPFQTNEHAVNVTEMLFRSSLAVKLKLSRDDILRWRDLKGMIVDFAFLHVSKTPEVEWIREEKEWLMWWHRRKCV